VTDTFVAMIKDEEGATLVEYGLVLALISVAAIAVMTQLGAAVNTQFSNVQKAIAGA